MGPDGTHLGKLTYVTARPRSVTGHSEVPDDWKKANVTLSSRRTRRRIWGARGWSVPAQSLGRSYNKSENPLTFHSQGEQGQIMPFLPEYFLWWFDCLCGWRERSRHHIPRLQQGLWHCFLRYVYCQTSEIWTGQVDDKVSEKFAGLLGSECCL